MSTFYLWDADDPLVRRDYHGASRSLLYTLPYSSSTLIGLWGDRHRATVWYMNSRPYNVCKKLKVRRVL